MLGRKLQKDAQVRQMRVVSGKRFVKRNLAQNDRDRADGRPAPTRRLWPFCEEGVK